MISDEQLLQWKKILTADEIDDSEQWAMWAATEGVELIDEVLELRKEVAAHAQGMSAGTSA